MSLGSNWKRTLLLLTTAFVFLLWRVVSSRWDFTALPLVQPSPLTAGPTTLPGVQPLRSMAGPHDYGYLVNFWASDQLTGAAMNMLSIQCLASKLSPKLVVVEPFLVDTYLGGAFGVKDRKSFDRKNKLKLSDIYDIDTWHNVSDRYHYNRLASWESFIQHTPQDVILVENVWTNECDLNALNITYSAFFELFKLQVVRTACLNFKKSGAMNAGQFRSAVYRKFSPEQATVMINSMPGIGGISPWSTAVEGKACNKRLFRSVITDEMVPSQRIKRDAEEYIKRYFGGQTEYISLMVRMEHYISSHRSLSYEESIKGIFQEMYQRWSDIQNKRNIHGTFLAMDVGKHGCDGLSLRKFKYAELLNAEMHNFFDNLYNGSTSFTEWEESFEKVSGVKSGSGISGYVAILQKEIASRGRYLILLGGGSFQQSAGSLFKRAHIGQDLC